MREIFDQKGFDEAARQERTGSFVAFADYQNLLQNDRETVYDNRASNAFALSDFDGAEPSPLLTRNTSVPVQNALAAKLKRVELEIDNS